LCQKKTSRCPVRLNIGVSQIQTKFTWTSGQDPGTEPFDVNASIPQQVRQSVDRSLYNLRHGTSPATGQAITITDAEQPYIDCFLLHNPFPTLVQTLQAWTTLQRYVPHSIRRLGICNASLPILQVLYLAKSVTVRPSVVQRRFHADTNYDTDIRTFCAENGIEYQCYGVLKSNPALLSSAVVCGLARESGTTPEVALYFLVMDLGSYVRVLNGTRSVDRMTMDINGLRFLKEWAADNQNEACLQEYRDAFAALLTRRTSPEVSTRLNSEVQEDILTV